MKKITSIILLYFISSSVFSQKAPIEVMGGNARLSTIVYDDVIAAPNLSEDSFYLNVPCYYEAQIQMDENGSIGKSAVINWVSDSSLNPTIVSAIQKTEGQWTNNTKRKILVIIPVYVHMKTSPAFKNTMITLKHQYFNNWKKEDVYYMEMVDITILGFAH